MLFRSEERRIKTTAAAWDKAKQEQGRPTETATAAEEDQPPQRSAPEAKEAPLLDSQPSEASSPQEAPWYPEGATSTNAPNLVEHPVYFISTVLRDTRAQYPMPQKLLFALPVASRKLRHYFQGHPIKVLSSYPPRESAQEP